MSRVTTTRDATTIGNDTFTWRTVADEQAVGGGGDVVVTGAGAWAIGVYVESSWLTPADYAKTRGGSAGDVLQPTTLDGKPAARTVDASGTSVAHYVANAGRMYSIALMRGFDARPPLVTDATLDLIARSITFMTPAARPTPTPAPTFTPAVEALADAVAAAFAASDADRLHDVLPAACWFFSASYDGGGAAVSRDVFAANLRTSFVQGRRVSVEPRPIKADAPLSGSFWIWSTWSAYGTQPFTPQSTVQLVFGQIDGRWYWVAAMFNATR